MHANVQPVVARFLLGTAGEVKQMITLAAVADLHCYADLTGAIQRMLSSVNDEADILVLPGDLTLGGDKAEADILIGELRHVRIPIVAVLGNHDFQSNAEREILSRLRARGVIVLDGTSVMLQVNGQTVGFAGVKGFCGGFSPYIIAEFGEPSLKDFVRAGHQEVAKLQSSMASLRGDFRVVVLHYAPVRETVIGEPPELHPFLGSSELREPLDRYGADVIFHGHAHFGSRFGRTERGIPVYNVALPVVRRYMIYQLGE